MLDFSNLQEILLPTVKKVKLELFNSFEEDTMTSFMKKEDIPFDSLRQKYGISQPGNQYPLPIKYVVLLDFFKNLEMGYWRN